MSGITETEVKVAVTDVSSIIARLTSLGFEQTIARSFESNWMFDTPSETLRNSRLALRVREFNGRIVLTQKGPPLPGPHKSREENEIFVSDLDTTQRILERLGFHPVFRYEKYRSEFHQGRGIQGHVLLDETPIGNYLELEGEAAWIDRTAVLLGYDPADYILESYGRLYSLFCQKHGLTVKNMIFSTDKIG